MLAERFLETILADNVGPAGKVLNPYRSRSVAFSSDKQIVYLPAESTIDVPFFSDRKLTPTQLDILFVQLVRSAKHGTTADLLIDTPASWERLLNEMIRDLQVAVPGKLTKIAILGHNLNKFHDLLNKIVKTLDFVEVFEHKAFKTDIVILPLGVPTGRIVARTAKKQEVGLVVYEDFVKRLSFHSDDQMREWLQLCTDQIDKE